MTAESDNDLETLLERSFDEQYSKKVPSEGHDNIPGTCPFANKNKSRIQNRKQKTRKINRVEEPVFNKRLLPSGWARLYHESGMYYYCHVASHVVTWSMPYQLELEPGRVHRVPVRAIPCLSYMAMKRGGTEDWTQLIDIKKTPTKQSEDSEPIPEDSLKSLNNFINSINNSIKEENMEEGELESSDEESKNKKLANKKDVLPKRYQIEKEPPIQTRGSGSNTSITVIKRQHSESANEAPSTAKHPRLSHNKPPASDSSSTTVADPVAEDLPETKSHCNGISETEIKEDSIDYCAKFLEPTQFRNYCDKLFTFTDEYKNLSMFTFQRKNKKDSTNPNLNSLSANEHNNSKSGDPNQIPANCTQKVKIPNKNIYIDLAGRSLSCILNMYCQQAFGATAIFKFNNFGTGGAGGNTAENSRGGIHDFEVQCEINGTSYGLGQGKTKKLAKHQAVLKTLEILIPNFSHKIAEVTNETTSNKNASSNVTGKNYNSLNGSNANHGSSGVTNDDAEDEIFGIFDSMEMTDPRILGYCMKLNTMTPNDVFMECVNRHCIPDSQISSKIEKRDRHNVFKFKVGDKEVEVACENKREGRQLAAQYMLAKMHPHIQSWGGVMRLYGPGSKPVKRFDMAEMQNLLLEDRGGVKSNLINLLRRKMLMLHDEWNESSCKTKAKFKVAFDNLPVIVFHPDATPIDQQESSSKEPTNQL